MASLVLVFCIIFGSFVYPQTSWGNTVGESSGTTKRFNLDEYDASKDQELKDFLAEVEDYRQSTYKDINENPTVGYGANLNSPEVPGILKNMGIDYDAVRSGSRTITPEEAGAIKDVQIREKQQYFNNIRRKDFKNSDINESEMRALMSLMYNNPKLIGPNMRGLLDQNDDYGAAKEILFRSNKGDKPGIKSRREKEAQMYLGERLSDFLSTLSPEELQMLSEKFKGE